MTLLGWLVDWGGGGGTSMQCPEWLMMTMMMVDVINHTFIWKAVHIHVSRR